MKIEKLLDYFPATLWQKLAQEYQVDRYVKKLEGKQVCLFLMYAMLKGKTLTLRTLEEYYGSSIFQTYAGWSRDEIEDRLTTHRDILSKYEKIVKIQKKATFC